MSESTVRNGDIGTYYDASTGRFLLLGGSGDALAIHRGLWGKGISTAEAAAAHVNDIIHRTAMQYAGEAPARVCDLGCGVGGSVLHLARCWPDATFLGVTISAAQVQRARAEAEARGLSDRCTFRLEDFVGVAEDVLPRCDLAIAVESHVHAASADAFLTASRHFLRPGGVLMIVDDMLLRPENTLSPRQGRIIATFRKGWRLGHVPDREGLVARADAAGFELLELTDLTPLLRLNRLRDRVLHVAGPAADRLGLNGWPLFGNMIGGNALTRSYQLGLMGYTLLALRLSKRD